MALADMTAQAARIRGEREREQREGHKHNIKEGQTLVSYPQYLDQSEKTGLLLVELHGGTAYSLKPLKVFVIRL